MSNNRPRLSPRAAAVFYCAADNLVFVAAASVRCRSKYTISGGAAANGEFMRFCGLLRDGSAIVASAHFGVVGERAHVVHVAHELRARCVCFGLQCVLHVYGRAESGEGRSDSTLHAVYGVCKISYLRRLLLRNDLYLPRDEGEALDHILLHLVETARNCLGNAFTACAGNECKMRYTGKKDRA